MPTVIQTLLIKCKAFFATLKVGHCLEGSRELLELYGINSTHFICPPSDREAFGIQMERSLGITTTNTHRGYVL
jgi:hypothetical protein